MHISHNLKLALIVFLVAGIALVLYGVFYPPSSSGALQAGCTVKSCAVTGQICAAGSCRDCQDSRECPPSHPQCSRGVCVRSCQSSSDCDKTDVCVGDSGTNYLPPPGQCQSVPEKCRVPDRLLPTADVCPMNMECHAHGTWKEKCRPLQMCDAANPCGPDYFCTGRYSSLRGILFNPEFRDETLANQRFRCVVRGTTRNPAAKGDLLARSAAVSRRPATGLVQFNDSGVPSFEVDDGGYGFGAAASDSLEILLESGTAGAALAANLKSYQLDDTGREKAGYCVRKICASPGECDLLGETCLKNIGPHGSIYAIALQASNLPVVVSPMAATGTLVLPVPPDSPVRPEEPAAATITWKMDASGALVFTVLDGGSGYVDGAVERATFRTDPPSTLIVPSQNVVLRVTNNSLLSIPPVRRPTKIIYNGTWTAAPEKGEPGVAAGKYYISGGQEGNVVSFSVESPGRFDRGFEPGQHIVRLSETMDEGMPVLNFPVAVVLTGHGTCVETSATGRAQ